MDFTNYLARLASDLKAGNATEHTHRPALQTLLESSIAGIKATNEPRRIACGAPDYIITRGEVPIGYIEAKDVGVPLASVENDEQLKRYRASLRNLILTDYLEFRLYRNGELVQTARLAQYQKGGTVKKIATGAADVAALMESFLNSDQPTIASPRELAQRMARMAQVIRGLIASAFALENDTATELHNQFDAFKQVLLGDDLTPDQFADMYAQTICYGLFAARCNHTNGIFSRMAAANELPKTNPFLRKLFQNIAGFNLDSRIAWAVDDLADMLAKADMGAILTDFGKATRQEDPVVHFYETFLAAYDPRMREARGVYYTPEPVVSYIVRSVDAILQRDFGLSQGLADNSKVKLTRPASSINKKDKKAVAATETFETHRVQILDPATGTGTFLYSVIQHIRERFNGNAGMWPGYVAEHLLPRIYGFELLMAPYAVAHMKLGLLLKDSGYDIGGKETDASGKEERLRVYLTNTLEKAHELTGLPLFTQWLAEEAARAGEVKQSAPIMVVLGNPPYSGHSANKGDWMQALMRGVDTLSGSKTANYFECDALPLGERNPKWLNDDYVKFMRFAQWRIEQTGYGVLAFVTNHGFLDNPTFRGMRQSLMQTFDDIYLLDLHGNVKKKEKTPEGGKDDNVFDIQQGVAISLFVKRQNSKKAPKQLASVQHADLQGLRATKYEWLWAHDVTNTQWTQLAPQSPQYLAVPRDTQLLAEYEKNWKITDAMPLSVLGFQTHRDDFAIDFEKSSLEKRIIEMRDKSIADDAFAERHSLADNRDWKLKSAREVVQKDSDWREKLVPCAYRPFDIRWGYFSEVAMDYPRRELIDNVVHQANFCLNVVRQTKSLTWQHAVATDKPAPAVFVEIKDGSSVAPLYLYPTAKTSLFEEAPSTAPAGRRPNIAPEFIADCARITGATWLPDGQGSVAEGERAEVTFGPEDIFYYAYAVFYSPGYRARYAQFLKTDFPRLPITSQRPLFAKLITLGKSLVDLHLMKHKAPSVCSYPVAGDNRVEKVSFETDSPTAEFGKVCINATQYFANVPRGVWVYQIGGYQVANKWLKDRKGRLLTFAELQHYSQVLAALASTMALQTEIDAAINAAGGWPMSQ